MRFSRQQHRGVHTAGKPDGRDRPARHRVFNGTRPKLEYEKLGKHHTADYKFEAAAAGLQMLNRFMLLLLLLFLWVKVSKAVQ